MPTEAFCDYLVYIPNLLFLGSPKMIIAETAADDYICGDWVQHVGYIAANHLLELLCEDLDLWDRLIERMVDWTSTYR